MTAHSKFNVSDEISEISGDKLADMMKGELGPEIAAALIGCRIYRVDPEKPATIESCDQQSGLLRVLDADGTRRTFALSGGYLYLEPPISALLDQYQALVEQHQVAQRQDIGDFGFGSKIRTEDFEDLSIAVRSAIHGPVPGEKIRSQLMKLMSGYENKNAFVNVTVAWVKASGGEILPDVLIQLLPALRKAGRHLEAIEMSDFLVGPCDGLKPDDRRILLTIRAAAYLDKLEPELKEFQRCVTESQEVEPSEYIDSVLAKLKRLIPSACTCTCSG